MYRNTRLEREVAAIGDLPRNDLVARWVKTYGCPPPKGIKRGLLERSATWHLQSSRIGGLSAETKRTLRRLFRNKSAMNETTLTSDARLGDNGPSDKSGDEVRPLGGEVRAKPGPGTRLVREWNGRTHVIEVVDGGFVHDGTVHRSLSAIARRITGAHWSGPRFFGL